MSRRPAEPASLEPLPSNPARTPVELLAPCVLAFLALLCVLPGQGHGRDLHCRTDWMLHVNRTGVTTALQPPPEGVRIDSSPVWLYGLAPIGRASGPWRPRLQSE